MHWYAEAVKVASTSIATPERNALETGRRLGLLSNLLKVSLSMLGTCPAREGFFVILKPPARYFQRADARVSTLVG